MVIFPSHEVNYHELRFAGLAYIEISRFLVQES